MLFSMPKIMLRRLHKHSKSSLIQNQTGITEKQKTKKKNKRCPNINMFANQNLVKTYQERVQLCLGGPGCSGEQGQALMEGAGLLGEAGVERAAACAGNQTGPPKSAASASCCWRWICAPWWREGTAVGRRSWDEAALFWP